MPVAEQHRMNALLADPDQVNVARLLADGRIGLYVVSQLARRHGITVRLQSNIYGGVQAVLVVPQALLGSTPDEAPEATGPARDPGPSGPAPVPAPRRQPDTAVPDTSVPDTAPGPGPSVAPTAVLPAQAAPPTAVPSDPVPAHGTAPQPLPVRGAHEDRPTPAQAVPGIRPDDRRALAEHAGTPPVPRHSAVRGTMDKPRLPRRRAQEHIAPQLRDGPAPRQETEQLPGHDPGLMAAFQRGIGLAEAQQPTDPPHRERARHDGSAPAG